MLRTMLLGVFGLSTLTGPALAHHSYAMYDMRAEQSLSGTIERLEWANPHIIISLRAQTGTEVWRIEGHAPFMFKRNGFDRKQLKVGDEIGLTFHPLRDGQGGSLASVTLADGRTFDRFGVLRSS